MLPLDSPMWKQLKHAYGPAQDTPGLIKAIAESDPAEMRKHPQRWNDVWGSLLEKGCGKGTISPLKTAGLN